MTRDLASQSIILVGIYRDRREECSACVTIDLEALEQEPVASGDDEDAEAEDEA